MRIIYAPNLTKLNMAKKVAKKRFTFADAKERIKELETVLEEQKDALAEAYDMAGLDTDDNTFTRRELNIIRFLKGWAIVGPLLAFTLGYLI